MRRYSGFEVTLREVLISILIIGIMIGMGFFISNGIHNSTSEGNEKYFKSLKINDDPTIFNYAAKTSVGNTMTYGTFTANEPVTDEDIEGEYFYIEKVKEIYTMHTRTVSYKCGKSRCHRTETYWTWDYAGSEDFHTKTFKFMGNSYPFELIRFNNTEYLDTATFGNIRFKYYIIPKEFNGTLYANLKDNKLKDTTLFAETTINKIVANKEHEADNWVIGFWVGWILLSIVISILFVALDNKYLNGNK